MNTPRLEQHDWAEPDLFLMADEALIETAHNAAFELCPMVKAPGPVLMPTQTWEGGDGAKPRPIHQDALDGSVLFDPLQQKFHLWYCPHNRLVNDAGDPALGDDSNCKSFKTQGSAVCYATSTDGIKWDKPVTDKVKFNGSYQNNMINLAVSPILSDQLGGVVPNYTGQGPQLVAFIYSPFDDPIYPRGITVAWSDDGFDFSPHFPPVLPLDGDAHCLMWDSRQQCYLCTTRSTAHAHELERMRQQGLVNLRHKRHVALAKSRDLIHWTPMLTVLEADEKDGENAELYRMYVVPYGNVYLGFVQLFYVGEHLSYGPLDVHLAVSRDLATWTRIGDRAPILPRGESGHWDQAHVSLFTNPPHPQGDRMRFWYGGKDTEHWQAGNAALSTATLRRDGFACWHAGAEGGVITSSLMNLNWATWPMLNVDATEGEAILEILDAQGKPIEGCSRENCQPITGDHLRAIVNYGPRRGNFVRHTGPVRFRVHLRNAKLYALKLPNVTISEEAK